MPGHTLGKMVTADLATKLKEELNNKLKLFANDINLWSLWSFLHQHFFLDSSCIFCLKKQ